MKKKVIMNDKEISRAVKRISHEIIEKNRGIKNLAVIGIQTEGVYLAERIVAEIERIENKKLPSGTMDVTMYRDDAASIRNTIARETNIPFNINNKVIILVDDVLYAGRTVRAALDEIMDFGRPRAIRLVVLVDRGRRELPIRADFVGKKITTTSEDTVIVNLKEAGKTDRVLLQQKD